jgi:hypothetical protein
VAAGREVRRLLEDFAQRWKLPPAARAAVFEFADLGPAELARRKDEANPLLFLRKILPFVATGRSGDDQDAWAEALARAIDEYQKWRAAVLQARDHAGRPLDTGYLSGQDELLEALRLTATLLRRQGKRVTQENLAAYLPQARPDLPRTDPRQLRRWLRRYGLDWETVRRLLS